MNRRTSSKARLLLALLLNATFSTLGLETPNVTRNEGRAIPVHESLEKSSSSSSSSVEVEEDRLPSENSITTTMETYQKLSINEKNVTAKEEFRPSFHLGEIKESRIDNPFNAPRHFNLDDGGATRDESYDERSKRLQVVFGRNTGDENLNHETVGSLGEEGRSDGARKDRVTFRDAAYELPGHDAPFKEQHTFHQRLPSREKDGATQSFEPQDQQIFEQGVASYVWGKPSKFQGDSLKPEIEIHSNDPFLHSPVFHDRPIQQSYDFQKPNDGLVYVQESSFTRTRKFPYSSIYQPHVGYQQQIEVVNDLRPSYPVKKRGSPWTKILHLIGTILPLGLLIAALTPNVVKVDNATQPNIVLSKWRVADLPVEHKQARFTPDAQPDCEERSVCRVILAGGDAGSTVLQNILWNLATRTSTATAKKSGLHEVFKAVKKRDCANVPCQSPLSS
ncbi:uncharacterized protein LOC122713415 [Apis laboriosa]|uniref:uncharacterized protein LOC122713415 n=1 Tax=Apis laboriosa TaxID=183418 RepID=UPI001CC781C5|nr:uncharacterized protein LOC122713415 [Apis laboriosa]